MKIGLLTCALPPEPVLNTHGPFLTMFQHLLGGQGFTFENWNVEDLEFPASPDQADAWLITGARHGAYEDHAFIPPLEDFIRAAFAVQAPMIGICFGHQLIAQALGARVEKFAGGWAVGRKAYDLDGLGPVHLNAWHQDQVLDLPKGAQVIASNEFTKFAGLRYGDHCLTLQPHPEITPQIIKTYADWQMDRGTFSPDFLQNVIAQTALPSNEADLGQMLGAFLKAAHAKRAAVA